MVGKLNFPLHITNLKKNQNAKFKMKNESVPECLIFPITQALELGDGLLQSGSVMWRAPIFSFLILHFEFSSLIGGENIDAYWQ
jgi:hypothetical protein